MRLLSVFPTKVREEEKAKIGNLDIQTRMFFTARASPEMPELPLVSGLFSTPAESLL